MGFRSDIFTGGINKDKTIQKLYHSNNIYDRASNQWYSKFNRFGCIDPYNNLNNAKEYLFFTKMDLHIVEPGTDNLNPELKNNSFFTELINRYPLVIDQLQQSSRMVNKDLNYPFMNVLSNSVKSNMDLPSISADMVDTSSTLYGTSIKYRGDAFSADEGYDFSLEFEDTKYLELYHLFKAIEEYERLKNVGLITPPNIDGAPVDKNSGYACSYYIANQIIHDQFAIFKFIVDEDYEDILYYAIAQGVSIKSVPRDSFSNLSGDNGLKYSIDFHSSFVFDMEPWILSQFNNIIVSKMGLSAKSPNFLEIYDSNKNMINGEWAVAPFVVRSDRSDNPNIWLNPDSMKYKYKLKWRLS